MVLKSYFDGGNQADSRLYKSITLAVASGTDEEWNPFIRDWNDTLRLGQFPPLHTTDAVSRVNAFAGWSEAKADSYLRNCVRLVEKHFIKVSTEYLPGIFGIYCFTVTINLADYVSHARAHPDGPQNANKCCTRHALADTLLWAQNESSCEHIHCIFDQGELFYGYLTNILESKKAKKDAWLLNRITMKAEGDSRFSPPLQLADLFAWVESHREEAWNPDWKKRLLRLPYSVERYDESNMGNVNHEDQAAWRTWKIPRRTPTK